MSRTGQFAASVGLGLVSLIVARALLELGHFYGWHPDKQLAQWSFASPGRLMEQLAIWWIVAVVAVLLWVPLDYYFYRGLELRETRSDRTPQKWHIEFSRAQTEPRRQKRLREQPKQAEDNPNISYVVTHDHDRTTILVLAPRETVSSEFAPSIRQLPKKHVAD